MSATLQESTSHFYIDRHGPGLARLYEAVGTGQCVQFTLSNGLQMPAVVTEVSADEADGVSEEMKKYHVIVKGTTTSGTKDRHRFIASYNAHNRSGRIQLLDA